ncbi:hypothetical protein P43SY_002365 [Pythium insidiosum]|uniref:Peptidase M3A/M3B catalytic domain-containing protein n=1 Tax=Pythium insidiosum TaxID=114742 RepID=A0AAD5QET5_PYTIN|nr:hypothetical protein P43SY_002365 [Pythium insidiosum]
MAPLHALGRRVLSSRAGIAGAGSNGAARRLSSCLDGAALSESRAPAAEWPSPSSRPGLFRLPQLLHPRDFARLTETVKSRCRVLKTEISNAICSVIDAAELCRNVHPDDKYREAASACFTDLSDFIQNLNADVDLYAALRALTEDASQMQSFTEEQRRMAVLLRQEFERDGIHLSHGGRRRVVALQNDITQLSMDFQRVLFTARDWIEVPEPLMRPLPHSVLAECERKLLNRSVLRVPTDPHVMNTVLKWIGDENVRREMYLKANACAKENLLAQEELGVLLAAKQKGAVAMWDLPYYMGMLKAQRFRIDSRVLAAYFPLERCLEGLDLLCRELFGLQLVSVPMDPHESWHPDVHKLALRRTTAPSSSSSSSSEDDATLGHIYFDLYPRAHKYNHAAHFTIRCGKRLSPSRYQKPLVALVCNFNKPAPHAPSLLSHSEVETLFHEFGHALHSLLSRTEFQHLSGTRASLDFVETPSHLFEYFAWDYRVVREFARHHATGEALPEEMMTRLKQSKHMFAAMDAQTQCLYSLLDLQLFGAPANSSDAPTSSTALLRELQNAHTLVPHVEGTCWHTRFGHLVGYGAGYYSYLYSRVFASAIWQHRFAAAPLSRSAGQELHDELMIHGGARAPQEILTALVGQREPTAASYLEELGIRTG